MHSAILCFMWMESRALNVVVLAEPPYLSRRVACLDTLETTKMERHTVGFGTHGFHLRMYNTNAEIEFAWPYAGQAQGRSGAKSLTSLLSSDPATFQLRHQLTLLHPGHYLIFRSPTPLTL